MKTYTAEDCVNDEYNDDGSRSLYFDNGEDLIYEIQIESITLQLSEEIEHQNGGTVKEFAALMLNKHLSKVKEREDIRDFFEEISD